MSEVLSSPRIHPSPGKWAKSLVKASAELMRGRRWGMTSCPGPVTCRAELSSLPSASLSRPGCSCAQSRAPRGMRPAVPAVLCCLCRVLAARNTPTALLEGLHQAFVWWEGKSCQAPLWWDKGWSRDPLWLTPTERCPPLCCSGL